MAALQGSRAACRPLFVRQRHPTHDRPADRAGHSRRQPPVDMHQVAAFGHHCRGLAGGRLRHQAQVVRLRRGHPARALPPPGHRRHHRGALEDPGRGQAVGDQRGPGTRAAGEPGRERHVHRSGRREQGQVRHHRLRGAHRPEGRDGRGAGLEAGQGDQGGRLVRRTGLRPRAARQAVGFDQGAAQDLRLLPQVRHRREPRDRQREGRAADP